LETLLAELKDLGIKLRTSGDKLRFTAPTGALTPELRSRLQSSKAEILEYLRSAIRYSPPSSAQRRFWSLQQLNPSATFFNAPFLFRLRGPLDAPLLKRSFDAIVARYEILRTTLQQLDGELTQVIEPSRESEWEEADLLGQPELSAKEYLDRELRLPFDHVRSSGLRVLLLRTAEDDYLLHFCFHNTLFDFPSLMIVLRELAAHYRAFATAREPDLPEPVQYTEFVSWQESFKASGVDERRQYWEDWFRPGPPPAWNWSHLDKPVTAATDFSTHRLVHRLSPEITERIRALCRRHGTTTYIAALAACFQTIRHFSGCSDITIGTTYADRQDWRFGSLIGATTVVLALRVDLSDEPGTGALLSRVREVLTASLLHQTVPGDRVVPFRVVMSAFPETPAGKLELPGIEVTWIDDWIYSVSRPELYVIVWESESLNVCWLPRKDVFEPGDAAAMNRYYEEVLTAMAG
jgi:hypothetical protein